MQVIACLTVNDVFVTDAWGEAHEVGDKIRMLADPTGKYTKVNNIMWYLIYNVIDDCIGTRLGVRCSRYSWQYSL